MTDSCEQHSINMLLIINGGSSSIRFALYEHAEPLRRLLGGKVDRVGLSGTNLTFTDTTGKQQASLSIDTTDQRSTVMFLLGWLEAQPAFASVQAVGHRVVHGMTHTEPELVTPELLDELHRIISFAPEHLPLEIKMIEILRQRYPALPQIACFDTAFHSSMPRVARLLPLPRRYDAKGIQRYGFHGLSCAYLIEEFARVAGTQAAMGRVILAHLGNGSSLTAVQHGLSVDTSMGFTPAAGVPMSTRSGDLDPGIAPYLEQTEQMTSSQFYKMVNRESGLLGISGSSSDMRDLLACESEDLRAAEAIALFCYQVKKWIGAYAAVLGGLDTLVFTGGIGENSPSVRTRICAGLGFLGITLNETDNQQNAAVISTDSDKVSVRVIHTDEELMIARSVCRILVSGVHTGD